MEFLITLIHDYVSFCGFIYSLILFCLFSVKNVWSTGIYLISTLVSDGCTVDEKVVRL
jgi:hypothetical protein